MSPLIDKIFLVLFIHQFSLFLINFLEFFLYTLNSLWFLYIYNLFWNVHSNEFLSIVSKHDNHFADGFYMPKMLIYDVTYSFISDEILISQLSHTILFRDHLKQFHRFFQSFLQWIHQFDDLDVLHQKHLYDHVLIR